MKSCWSSLCGVRAVIFDLGGTVISMDHERVAKIIEGAGWDLDGDWVSRAERESRRAVDRVIEERAEPVQVSRAFFEAYLAAAGVDRSGIPAVHQQLLEFDRRFHLWNRPIPGVPEALRALARAGYRIAALSNSDGRAKDLLGELGLAGDFEFVIDSKVVGLEKPDRRIFHLACERLGMDVRDCLYVGDLLTVDIDGARNAGLRAVLLDHYGCYRVDQLPSNVPRAVEAGEIVEGLAAAPAAPVTPVAPAAERGGEA